MLTVRYQKYMRVWSDMKPNTRGLMRRAHKQLRHRGASQNIWLSYDHSRYYYHHYDFLLWQLVITIIRILSFTLIVSMMIDLLDVFAYVQVRSAGFIEICGDLDEEPGSMPGGGEESPNLRCFFVRTQNTHPPQYQVLQ